MIDERRVRKYCRDDISKIENYEEAISDKDHTWHLHHRLELTLDGEFALTPEQLKMHDMYYNRPYYELIFLTPAEHIRIHHKGENHHFYNKTFTEEHRRKLSESHKGQIVWNKGKKGQQVAWNKGKKGLYLGENHPFYGKHHSEDTRRKISDTLKGRTVTDETRRKMREAQKRRWAAVNR